MLASITPKGREVIEQATEAHRRRPVRARLADEGDCDELTELLTGPRTAAGDF